MTDEFPAPPPPQSATLVLQRLKLETSHLHHPIWQLMLLQWFFFPLRVFFFFVVSHSKFNNYSVLFFCGSIKTLNLKIMHTRL